MLNRLTKKTTGLQKKDKWINKPNPKNSIKSVYLALKKHNKLIRILAICYILYKLWDFLLSKK